MIHLINRHQLALHALHVALMRGQDTQYLWIDSTTLPVCKNQRIQRHKSLVKIASRGKSSMGWSTLPVTLTLGDPDIYSIISGSSPIFQNVNRHI